MSASASDKARKSYSFLQKTLSTGIDDTETTLTPNNVTSIPTDTGVTMIIDRVDSNGTVTPTKREIVTGTISGGTITNLVRGQHGTTAQAHSSGAVIEFVMAGNLWNDFIDAFLQDHSNPNGNHKTLTDDNGNEWLERGQTASAVNHVKSTNAATGNAPELAAAGGDTNINLAVAPKGTGNVYNKQRADGWVELSDSWSYSAWTSATRIAQITVPTDATNKFSAGMRIRFTQPTDGVKYGIIVKVEATTLTVFLPSGTDFDNEAITSPAYSTQKAPKGFSLSPTVWSLTTSSTSDRSVDAASFASLSETLSVGIGAWHIWYKAVTQSVSSNLEQGTYLTLSTDGSTETNPETTAVAGHVNNNATTKYTIDTLRGEGDVLLTSAATLTLMGKDLNTTDSNVKGSRSATIIKAVCAYL